MVIFYQEDIFFHPSWMKIKQVFQASSLCLFLIFVYFWNWYIPLNVKRSKSEADTGGVLCEKMFSEISQNSQENTCIKNSFIKRETLAQVFLCGFCQILKNAFLRNTSGRLLLQSASSPLYFESIKKIIV